MGWGGSWEGGGGGVEETWYCPLKNLRKLLKPGGTLILHELTNTALVRTGFAIGLVPGRWLLEEPYRVWGPLMSASDWEVHLKRSDYTGVNLCFEDYPYEPNRINNILIAKGEASVPQPRALPPELPGKRCHAGSPLPPSFGSLSSHLCSSWRGQRCRR